MVDKARPNYRFVSEWIKNYGSSGASDDRAVTDFIICETAEAVSSLRAELYGMSQGLFDEEILDKIVGVKRKVRHGSYDAWAKMMLMWMTSAKP